MANDQVKAFLDHALDQLGDRVQYGTEVSGDAADSKTWDSGELVEWSAHKAGAAMTDGTWRQYRQLATDGHAIDAQQALDTPGALLFKFSSDPMTGMPGERQVFISLGGGRVIDASGNTISTRTANPGEFTHAAVMPEFADADAADMTNYVTGRLDTITNPPPPGYPSNPTETDTTPPVATPPVAPHEKRDPVQLRKDAIDAAQEADQRERDIASGQQHRADLANRAQAARQAADDIKAQGDHEFVLGRQSKLEADQFDADAAVAQQSLDALRASGTASADDIKSLEDNLQSLQSQAAAARTEAQEHAAKASQLRDESYTKMQAADSLDVQIQRTDAALQDVQAQATAARERAAELQTQSNVAVDDYIPDNPTPAGGHDVVVADIPDAPPPGASRDDIQKWVEQRDLATQSRENAAAEKLHNAADFDNIAEAKNTLQAQAESRVAAANERVAAEQARIADLQSRLDRASDQQQRFNTEMQSEQAQLDQLKAAGDTAGAAAVDARINDLMQKEAAWQAQKMDLAERIDQAQQTIQQQQEDAADYTKVAQDFDEEADRATDLGDQYESDAAKLQQDATYIDKATDPVEDVLGANVKAEVKVTTPLEDLDVQIPGRDVNTIPQDELQRDLPMTVPTDATDGSGPQASIDGDQVMVTVGDQVDSGGDATFDSGIDVPSDAGSDMGTEVADADLRPTSETGIDPNLIEIDPPDTTATEDPSIAMNDSSTFDTSVDVTAMDSGSDTGSDTGIDESLIEMDDTSAADSTEFDTA
jgi:hypothetical protein